MTSNFHDMRNLMCVIFGLIKKCRFAMFFGTTVRPKIIGKRKKAVSNKFEKTQIPLERPIR